LVGFLGFLSFSCARAASSAARIASRSTCCIKYEGGGAGFDKLRAYCFMACVSVDVRPRAENTGLSVLQAACSAARIASSSTCCSVCEGKGGGVLKN
jgi:hypothetical protein